MMEQDNQVKKKVLLLAANPKDLEPLRLGEEFSKIKKILASATDRDDFAIIQGEAITVDDLRNYLLTNQPNIIHFSGHAGHDGIYIENSSGYLHHIPIQALAELFGLFKDKIECVILNACYAENQAQAINEYIPYVIGTNEAIQDQDAIHFAAGFYDALFTGYGIKKSFDVGYNSVEMNRTESNDYRAVRLPNAIEKKKDNTPPIILLENKTLLANYSYTDSNQSIPITVKSKQEREQSATPYYYYDFFISYVNSDAAWVHGFLQTSLEQAGKRCLTVDDFRLGHSEQVEIERAIQQSERILLVLTPEYLNNPKHIDAIIDALERYRGKSMSDWPVIPLLLREVNVPPRLDFLVGLDFSNEDTRLIYLKRLIDTAIIPFDDFATRPASPYPGLRAFKEAEADLFYGRNQEISDLITHFRNSSFLAVVGASGSGKSSLIYAGLISALQKTSLLGSNKWCIKRMRPELDAIKVFEDLFPYQVEQKTIENLLQKNEAQHVLFFIDQFEEIFSQPESIATRFFQLLEQLNALSNVYVVLTLRADFFHMAMSISLWPLIENNQYNLLPLKQAEFIAIICEPAKKSGVFIDPLLVERIINDAANEPGILPFIQETMNLLWDKLQYRYLPTEAYNALQLHLADGKVVAVGLKAAIALHAEASFKGLSSDDKLLAQSIFIRLVQFGEGRPDTRRQQVITDLNANGNGNEECFNKLIHYLSNDKHRLLVLSHNTQGKQHKVDIAHESLLTAWPRLTDWIISFKDNETMRRHFLYRANECLALDEKGAFLDKIELEKAIKWMSNIPATQLDIKIARYITISQKKQRNKMIKRFVMPLFFVMLMIMVYAFKADVYNLYFKAKVKRLESPMIHIKPNTIIMGREQKGLPYSPAWTIPRWDEYWIEPYEVTNERYCSCIKSDVCKDTGDDEICNFNSSLSSNLPVVNITLKAAVTYCNWLGRRIPHEAEWEFVARDMDAVTNTAKENEFSKLNVNIESIRPIDSSKNMDKTKKGIYGLVGNVSEWTISYAEPYPIRDDSQWCEKHKINDGDLPKIAVIRGANIHDDQIKNVSSWRKTAWSNEGYSYVGFRCVSDYYSN